MAAVLKELNAKYNFYILSSYVEGHVMQKFKSELNVFCLVSRPQKSECFFGKFIVEKDLKSFSGRNNSLNPPVFGFCDSLPYDLEESIGLRALIS